MAPEKKHALVLGRTYMLGEKYHSTSSFHFALFSRAGTLSIIYQRSQESGESPTDWKLISTVPGLMLLRAYLGPVCTKLV